MPKTGGPRLPPVDRVDGAPSVPGPNGAESAQDELSEDEAEAWIAENGFRHGPAGRIGAELEFLLTPRPTVGVPSPDLHRARRVLTRLPVPGRVSVEPGGQVELSTDPAPDLSSLLRLAHEGVRTLRRVASQHQAALGELALAPGPLPERLLRGPRYDTMEAWFDRRGPAGRGMMRASASIQVTVEAGPLGSRDSQIRRRWDVLHAMGPALVAAFANSPLRRGAASGWRSGRQGVWLALDPYRSAPVTVAARESLAQSWAGWCLDAPVMMVRRAGHDWTAPSGLTFRQWLRAGRAAVPDRRGPVLDDLVYHLSTLFPPVRARGTLEVRYLDAQPGDWWQVPIAVVAALTEDDRAADRVLQVCEPVRDHWVLAARDGLSHPGLARAAAEVIQTAEAVLRRWQAPVAEVVEHYAAHWTLRARAPSDDVLERRSIPPAPIPLPVTPLPVPGRSGGERVLTTSRTPVTSKEPS
jgi:glutamate--cysteine ligase